MILHHYVWGTDDVQIVEELPPHFLIVKSTIGNGNLALFSKLSEQQGRYFRNANKRFYDAGLNENGESMDPSDEYIPFVPDIMFDDDGKGYLLLIQPSALNTLEGVKRKVESINAIDKEVREHDEFYAGSLRNILISYELVERN